jgi:delta 1-pyrroline-5-carboxylate dehydrogenase
VLSVQLFADVEVHLYRSPNMAGPLALYREVADLNLARISTVMTELFSGSPQSVATDVGTVFYSKPRPFVITTPSQARTCKTEGPSSNTVKVDSPCVNNIASFHLPKFFN